MTVDQYHVTSKKLVLKKSCVGPGIQIKKTERSPTRAAAQLAPPPDTPLKKILRKNVKKQINYIFLQ
jgi:hypothetical protein